ncbi:MAG TPA: pitrilysin family protein [Mycobacteriales bacterium]|nr:pitrilysin family protein [Mycobacteriales bacterium]
MRRTVLPGGLRVLSEHVPGVRSVAIGIWVAVGSRHETRPQAGASHYLEHLLFKGTPTRSALDISAAFDRVGGEVNAWTAKEYTCYHAKVLDTDLPMAVEVLGDMVTASLLERTEVEAERGVIGEEIAMTDDEPGDLVHDVFARALYGDTPLGRPILGTVGGIEAISRDTIAGYWRRGYTPEKMVVTAAGNVQHGTLLRLIRQVLGPWLELAPPPAVMRPIAGHRERRGSPATRVDVVRRRTEQANVVLGLPGLPRRDPREFTMSVLAAALGGGMSSRLFQEIREKRGLAYSVYAYTSSYTDSGLFGVYVGCQPGRTRQVLGLLREQLADVASRGLTAGELELGKGQVRGSLVLGLEDTHDRMTRLGKGELLYGELLSVPQMLRRVEAVTLDEVRELAAEVLNQPLSLGVVGPFRDADRTFFEGAVA